MANDNGNWINDAIFYHIYPLGFCGAPLDNNGSEPEVFRLDKINEWSDHLVSLGVNALYLGPIFESKSHGYDTSDYYKIDRRLGNNESMKKLVDNLHSKGVKVVLDGVFNHVGRDFWAFRDVIANRSGSKHWSWFSGITEQRRSPLGDPFSYDTWGGYYSLVKLNLGNPDVKKHIFDAVAMWVRDFGIDGLRLDAADVMSLDFLRDLKSACTNLKPDFWLMGEIVGAGDYRRWANKQTLDSVTNYEAYKSLYSSHNAKNYFEMAHSLNREFGDYGLYKEIALYNFADNHDVNRVASTLKDAANLNPLYMILFTMPGVPSIYYGSEWGIEGMKANGSDAPLRPCLDIRTVGDSSKNKWLIETVKKLSGIRKQYPALRYGTYRQLHVGPEQLVFMREDRQEVMVIAVNSSDKPAQCSYPAPQGRGVFCDVLNNNERFTTQNGRLTMEIAPHWGRILRAE